MTRQPMNILYIMSDEHQARALGCAGHEIVQTPNLDALAAGGTRFTAAYTPSPICVPARAALATGRPVYETGYWCNGSPYDGQHQGWGHMLQAAGHPVRSIGKLHYRRAEDPTGFDEQVVPMHVVDGVGDILGAVRDELPVRHRTRTLSEGIGAGESGYTRYDRQITAETCRWLSQEAAAQAKPWVLFVSLVCPHFPLIAPEDFFALYPPDAMPAPRDRPEDGIARHPWIEALAGCQIYDRFFTEETRRVAIAAYYGLCSFLDDNIGRILASLEAAGLAGTTRVIYTSDHGDSLGTRGLWGKSTMYEEAAAVPLILAGPDVPAGRERATPVTLTDLHPTFLEGVGLEARDETRSGRSLFDLAAGDEAPDRVAFSEYHAAGAISGAFMIRKGRFKLIHYTGFAPELFDLTADPLERRDLAADPAHAAILADLQGELRARCDSDAVDARAKADQAALVARHGGRAAVVARGSFAGTPAPGEKPVYG